VAHRTRTKLEAAICVEMERQRVAHGHRILHYRVRMKSGKVARYDPAIAVHRGPILFLVEPCATVGGTVERATRFLDQHSPEIVLTVVAPGRIADRLPLESYDELYEAGDVPRLVQRIREQDPRGAIRPFTKRRQSTASGTSSRPS
jgi:hypothetical protein